MLTNEQNEIEKMLWDFDSHFSISPDDGQAVFKANQQSLLLPATPLQHLGDAEFCKEVGIKFPYVAGAMANGIASVGLVVALAKEKILSFFGAAGLTPQDVKAAILQIQAAVPEGPFGFNLIHSPAEPELEETISKLYCDHKVGLVEASAYMQLTLPLLKYRFAGIHKDNSGRTVVPNRVIGKVSRVEMAEIFFSPPPLKFLEELVRQKILSSEQAKLAESVPVAQYLTAEADSGGHTDNRPMSTLLPSLLQVRERIQSRYNYVDPLRVGVGGGISTPQSLSAAFSMGAAFVVVGSINQACVEAGTSAMVKKMLSQTRQADTMMAPAADMFEMGVKVQVLKKGTMFPMRAQKLYDLYKKFPQIEEIPSGERLRLQDQIFRQSFEGVWADTKAYFQKQNPKQIVRAERDPKHKMALIFRSYLGQSSGWANRGDPDRQLDYQIWCGPAMAAFNEWTRDSFLADPDKRDVVTVAFNLLVGAALSFRLHILKMQGYQPIPQLIIRPLTKEALIERVPVFRKTI